MEITPHLGQVLWTDDDEYHLSEKYIYSNATFKAYADEFHNNGYIVVPNSVDLYEINRALNDYSAWVEGNKDTYETNRKPNGNPPRLVDSHSEIKSICSLFENNSSVPVQDFLFGYETSIYTSLFFEVSTEQPIHRDVPVFRTSPENFYFGMWVALEDATVDNGTLNVIEGGHRVDVNQYEIAAKFYNDPYKIPELSDEMWNAYQEEVFNACHKENLVIKPITINKGDTLVWHPLLPHGGGEILCSGSTRHSIVFHTVPYGMPVYRQNIFFNRYTKFVTNKSTFKYKSMSSGRKYADFGGLKLRNR